MTAGGRELKFPVRTMCTAVLLIQHFYLFNNPTSAGTVETACACLLVASKIEDTPKKSKEIITAVLGPKAATTPTNSLEETRLHVLGLERHVLETLGFDFRQNSPQYYVIKICKDLKLSRPVAEIAWTISTDAFASTVYLIIPAHTAALACIILAAKLKRDTSLFPLDSSRFYSTRYKTNAALLQLLDLYTEPSRRSQVRLGRHAEFEDFLETCFRFREDIDRAVSGYERGNSQIFEQDLFADQIRDLGVPTGKLSDEGTVRYILDWEK